MGTLLSPPHDSRVSACIGTALNSLTSDRVTIGLTGVIGFGAGDGDGDVMGIADLGDVPVGIRRNCLDLGGVLIRGGVGLHSSL